MSSRLARPGAVLLALAVSLAVAAAPASASSCRIHATLHAPNHSPRINKDWTISVTASPRTRTHVKYQFLFHGRVVGTSYVLYKKNYTFKGHFRDPMVFPKRSLGIPLTLRVVLSNRCGTKHLDWKVKSRR